MQPTPAPEATSDEGQPHPVAPLSRSYPALGKSTTLTPVFSDRAAITWLLEQLLLRSGLSLADVASRMGCTRESVKQYVKGRRTKPGLDWFLRYVQVCGGHLKLDLS